MSVGGPWRAEVICSAAAKPGVKIAVIAVDRPATATREAPKSISTGRPLGRIRMLAGLMSRCRKPASCTCSRPSSIGFRIESISCGGSERCLRSRASSVSPGTSSITM